MKVFFDMSNLLSFIQSRDKSLYSESLSMLKKQVDLRFNFSKEEFLNDPNLGAWMIKELSQGIKGNIDYGLPFPERPLKSNSARTFSLSELMSIYLLEDEDIIKLKNSGAILVGGPGEELELFKKIFLLKEDYDFQRKWTIKNDDEFKSWDSLRKYSLPLTDLIIIDNYVLSDPSIIEINLGEFLRCHCRNCKVKINLILVSSSKKDAIRMDMSHAKDYLSKVVESETGRKPNITIIKSQKNHDRTIITNYLRIHTGDSINYWNNKQEVISKGDELHYFSLAKREEYELAMKRLEKLQEDIDWLQEHNSEFIYGDRKSGFLKFADNE